MDAWLRFRKNRLALIGLALVLMLVLAATLAPWLALHDPTRQSLIEKRARPGAKYLLGAGAGGAAPPRPAQRPARPRRLRHALHGQRHPARGRAVVPRARRPAAHGVVGPDGLHGPRRAARRAPRGHGPRPRHHGRGARLQPRR